MRRADVGCACSLQPPSGARARNVRGPSCPDPARVVDSRCRVGGAMKGSRKPGRRRILRPWFAIGTAIILVAAGSGSAIAQTASGVSALALDVQSLDGSGNNAAHPTWGQLNRPYTRVAPANYADGRSRPVTGPNARFVSNRTFNDVGQNIFSERRVTQWGWLWGQFLDHTFGLAQGGTEPADIRFNRGDPLETFTNDLGVIPFTRNAAAPGTGVTNARQQVNTVSSYIDGFSIYGGTAQREERLRANPNKAMVAGDVRANENIGLTATHTLFAREHNRIVRMLPNTLTAEQKFQIARRVVIAEQQYVTYHEFLPAMGVRLPAYTGYKSNVDATLSNEFATVGYRAHSQIHGEIEVETDRARYTSAQLAAFAAQGIKVEDGEAPDEVVLAIPLNVAFFNPDLLKQIGEGPVLQAFGLESQYKNDAIFDNHIRSVLFQIPKPGNTGSTEPVHPACFNGVVDLAAMDIERGRDDGMPSYNDLRRAYGLAPKASFADVVNGSETFPRDPLLTPGNEINDPNSLDFTALFDINGKSIPLGSERAESDAVNAKRRTGLAARLRAIYGNVNRLDAFVGMVGEPHVPGSEFGELQRAIWTKQFQALRDGDRYFYANQPVLGQIRDQLGIDFRHSLADIIAANTDIPGDELSDNVFIAEEEGVSAASDGGMPMASGAVPGSSGSSPGLLDGRIEHYGVI